MTFKELYQRLTSRIIWGNLLAMAVVTVLLVAGLFIYLSYYTHHGDTVTVPDVRGQRAEVAVHKLQALGLRAEVSDTGHVTTLAPDIILEQHIEAGTEVKEGRLVRLTINSSSARTIPLPNVLDGSLRAAEMRLRVLGLKLGAVRRIEGDLDLVYRVEIKGREVMAGERVSVEAPITLVVGDGKNEDIYNGDDSVAWATEMQQIEDQDLFDNHD